MTEYTARQLDDITRLALHRMAFSAPDSEVSDDMRGQARAALARLEPAEKPELVYAGYTEAQLRAAFALVRPASNWKNPIDAVVPADADRMAIGAAVLFYTGGEAEFTSLRGDKGYRVRSGGYYVNIGS